MTANGAGKAGGVGKAVGAESGAGKAGGAALLPQAASQIKTNKKGASFMADIIIKPCSKQRI